jgi:hypothetical protein
MRSVRSVVRSALAIAGLAASAAHGQTTAGSGTVIVLPLAANIPGAYATTVFVRNPNANSITLDVRYYQSDNATPPGTGTPYTCAPLPVAASAAVTFDLASQCTFAPGSTDNFGMIVLEDVTTQYKTNRFFAYSRTEDPTGNGFSVEGFPVGTFSSAPGNAPAEALGLKRTAAAPHYKANCFVGALNETVNYTLELRQGETGTLIGQIIGSVGPYHTTRILDVFTAAGAPAADYANVRAKFTTTTSSAMIGFCTIETTDNGSADFRVAKSNDARDNRQSRLACYGMDDCGADASSTADPATITDTTKRNIHYMIIDPPDFVKCDLVSDEAASRLDDLQIVLRPPSDSLTGTTPFANANPPYNAAPYTSGGAGQTSLYVYTGEKSTINGGVASRWYLDVSFRNGGDSTVPIKYGIKCTSGNGVTIPWLGTSAP